MYTTDEAQIGKITRIENIRVSTIAEGGKETIRPVYPYMASLFLLQLISYLPFFRSLLLL